MVTPGVSCCHLAISFTTKASRRLNRACDGYAVASWHRKFDILSANDIVSRSVLTHADTSAAIQSMKYHLRSKNVAAMNLFGTDAKLAMEITLSCHILLRFKSYSNDVKSHYVVVLFVCT